MGGRRRQDYFAAIVWFPVSITLLVYSVISATVALLLFSCRNVSQNQKGFLVCMQVMACCIEHIHTAGGHRAAVPSHSTKEEVALKENLCYGPVAPPPPPPPAATQTV